MTGDHHLEALDIFRGASIAAMILVNNPGDWSTVFPPLEHSAWDGCTAADVVFPFFVFIMGCALTFSLARRRTQPGRPWDAVARVGRRALNLVALGLALNVVGVLPHVASMRVPGVLQRLGLTYFATALIVRSVGAAAQGLIAVALLVGHWALMTLVSFGGGVVTPITRTHNLAGYVDARVFGLHTLMPGFDPEGLLGTAPTVATALAGALAGQWLRRHADRRRRSLGLVVGGLAAVAAGLAWSTVWPLNKSLWTGSYALLTSGLAAITLAACLFAVNPRAPAPWLRPFLWLGANPLAIYFGSELLGHLLDRQLFPWLIGGTTPKDWLYWHLAAPLGGDRGDWSSFIYAVAFVACWIGVSAVLYRRGIRIRV
jgi:predicted acyltransferase